MIDNDIYKFFSDYIFEKTGILYKESEYYRLEQRLKELTELLEVETIQDVYNLYQTNITPDMKTILINISTNNETFFFRDQKVFDSLTSSVYNVIKEAYPVGPIEIWSAACSTGQEPLSISMQTLKKSDADIFSRIKITATDISLDALKKAKEAIYTGLDVQRGLPITVLMSHFDQLEDETWKINNDIKSKITYNSFNLLDGIFPANKYHIIFCRNVLIYQNKENKEKILQNIYEALKPNGILYLGNGESLIGIKSDFKSKDFGGKTAYQKLVG